MLNQYEALRLAGRECEAALRALRPEQGPAGGTGVAVDADSGLTATPGAGGVAPEASGMLRQRVVELEERARQLKALRKAQLPLVRAVAERLQSIGTG